MSEAKNDAVFERAVDILKGGQSVKAVETILVKEGFAQDLITDAICRLKLYVYKRRKNWGVAFMIAGGTLLLIGFGLTVFLFHMDQNFDMVMYGFTLAGIGLMGYGTFEILQ
jgi:hypothetical protein